MQTGIHIGAIVDKHSLEPLTESIVRIMTTPADQKTIRAALELLGRAADINGVSLSNCSIVGDATHHHTHYPEAETEQETVDGETNGEGDWA